MFTVYIMYSYTQYVYIAVLCIIFNFNKRSLSYAIEDFSFI